MHLIHLTILLISVNICYSQVFTNKRVLMKNVVEEIKCPANLYDSISIKWGEKNVSYSTQENTIRFVLKSPKHYYTPYTCIIKTYLKHKLQSEQIYKVFNPPKVNLLVSRTTGEDGYHSGDGDIKKKDSTDFIHLNVSSNNDIYNTYYQQHDTILFPEIQLMIVGTNRKVIKKIILDTCQNGKIPIQLFSKYIKDNHRRLVIIIKEVVRKDILNNKYYITIPPQHTVIRYNLFETEEGYRRKLMGFD